VHGSPLLECQGLSCFRGSTAGKRQLDCPPCATAASNSQVVSHALEFGSGNPEDDNYREARQDAMNSGYFRGSKKDVGVVSQNLKAGYCETLWIYEMLGVVKFRKLLEAHGFQPVSPLDLDFTCSGAPAVPGI
jgi:hypothetical protein